MFDFGSLVTGGTQLLGSIFGAQANERLNAENRAFAAKQADLAFRRQKEYFRNYLAPSAQANLAKMQGYNPNYILQHGSPASGSVLQASTPETFSSGDILQRGLSNAALSFYQAQNLQSQSNKNNAESNRIALLTPKELEKLGYDTDTAKEIAKLAGANQELDLQLKNQDLQLKTAETATQQAMANVYHWQSLNSKFEFENLKPLEMQQIQTAITKDLAQVDLMIAQKNLTEQEAKLAVAQIYKTYMDAVSNRISANASMVGARAQQQMADNQSKLVSSQIQVNESIATANNAKAANLTIDTDTRIKSQHFVLESMRTSNEILGKQNSWYNARQTGEMIRDIGVGIGSALGGASNAIKSIGSMAVGAPAPIGFR